MAGKLMKAVVAVIRRRMEFLILILFLVVQLVDVSACRKCRKSGSFQFHSSRMIP